MARRGATPRPSARSCSRVPRFLVLQVGRVCVNKHLLLRHPGLWALRGRLSRRLVRLSLGLLRRLELCLCLPLRRLLLGPLRRLSLGLGLLGSSLLLRLLSLLRGNDNLVELVPPREGDQLGGALDVLRVLGQLSVLEGLLLLERLGSLQHDGHDASHAERGGGPREGGREAPHPGSVRPPPEDDLSEVVWVAAEPVEARGHERLGAGLFEGALCRVRLRLNQQPHRRHAQACLGEDGDGGGSLQVEEDRGEEKGVENGHKEPRGDLGGERKLLVGLPVALLELLPREELAVEEEGEDAGAPGDDADCVVYRRLRRGCHEALQRDGPKGDHREGVAIANKVYCRDEADCRSDEGHGERGREAACDPEERCEGGTRRGEL
mmetsp:Transcript_40697/g.99028  ORF Transcript_40697/g.99028 Transcript_40697/m.99028 type:complete len:379 (-) Transcript_40697:78-1214(-)